MKLKLTASGKDLEALEIQLEEEISKIRPLLKAHIISENGDKIEEILHDFLISRNLTISTESCNRWRIIAFNYKCFGSSNYFLGEFDPIKRKKTEILGVSEDLIKEKNSSFSRSCGDEFGLSELFKTDIALSTTGVAGPNSDEFNSEIGTVFIRLE